MSEPERVESFRVAPKADVLPAEMVQEAFVDPGGLEDFWVRWYLEGFIDQGQGKVKLLLGRSGAGKTHFLRHLQWRAESLGYVVVVLDAARTRMAAIDDVYRALAAGVPWNQLFKAVLRRVIAGKLGYSEFAAPLGEFFEWGESERQVEGRLLRRDFREQLDSFLKTMDMDGDFLLAARSAMHQAMGIASEDSHFAKDWLLGEKIGAGPRKSIGLRSPLSKRNARGLVISLASLIHSAWGRGLVLLIDNAETLALTARVEGRQYYTRAARDQSYEMLRELIDESAFSPFLFTVVGGTSEAISDLRSGFPSYPALWDRLQTEIATERPNLFADLIDLDRLWEQDNTGLHKLMEYWNELSWPHDSSWVSGASDDGTLGLEWGKPRRLIAKILTQRLTREAST